MCEPAKRAQSGKPSGPSAKAWDHQVKQVRIEINRYRVKNDFDVAKKICPAVYGVTYCDAYQDEFKRNALMEVLQECSSRLSGGKKAF